MKVLGYRNNQGRGKALRTGLEAAQGEIVVTIDFDLSYDVNHISRIVKTLEDESEVDVVLASCYMPGGTTVGISPFRLFISKTANFLYRYAFDPPVYTSTCVVRGYRREVVNSLILESNDKEIHLEILSKVLANGFRVKEIPATLEKRHKGISKSRFRAHSISHIIFFIHERPFALFGIVGVILSITGMLAVIVLLYTRFGGNESFNETYFSQIASPSFVIILFLSGLQMIGLGFLGIQNNLMKKELFKIQRLLVSKKSVNWRGLKSLK